MSEFINPIEFSSGQIVAGNRVLSILDRFMVEAKEKAEHPTEGDEVFTRSFRRGEEMFYSLALSKIQQLADSLKVCADELERNEL